MLRACGAEDTRIRLLPHPQRDAGVEHRVEIEVMAVELAFEPDHAANAHAAHQPPDPISQHVGGIQRLFDHAWISRSRGDFAYGGPFRSFDVVRTIPFRIFRDDQAALIRRGRPGATDRAVILLRVGWLRRLIGLLALLDARSLDGEVERLGRGGGVLAEIPQAETVIAIDGLDDIGLAVELDPHLAEIVAQQHADLAADGGIADAIQARFEHHASLGNKAVIVRIGRIEQRPRQPGQQDRRRRNAARCGDMIRRPQLSQARQLAHCQPFDAGVLDQRDQRDLQRL